MSTIAPPPAANAVLSAAAAGAAAENLDERMERIRRRNEELEQKHREAEADRLAALKNNAMVVTTRPIHAAGTGDGDDDDDWPRGHRYDTHEFAYETAAKSETTSAATGDATNIATPTAAVASLDGNKRSGVVDALPQKGPGGRDYKKFAEGEGPPPDPSFNFLADAERDGKQRRAAAAERAAKAANNGERNKDWRNQPGSAATTAADGAADNATSAQTQRSRGGLNGSFKSASGQRGHNNNNSSSSNNSNANHAPRSRASQRTGGTDDATTTAAGGRNGGVNNEFNQWKTERERIDEARIGRQRTGDGKWRREWDNEKFGSSGGGGSVEPTTSTLLAGQMDNIHIGGGGGMAPITTAAAGRHITVVNNNANVNSVEKRGNVTVSVNKDGEVKSVKLVTNRVIGTGRVGPRQLPATIIAVASAESAFPIIKNFTPRAPHASQGPPQPHPYYQQNNPLQQQHQQHHHHHQMPPFVQPTPAVFYDQPPPPMLPLAANLPPAARQFLDARPKLQDRLARHRQPVTNASDAPTGI